MHTSYTKAGHLEFPCAPPKRIATDRTDRLIKFNAIFTHPSYTHVGQSEFQWPLLTGFRLMCVSPNIHKPLLHEFRSVGIPSTPSSPIATERFFDTPVIRFLVSRNIAYAAIFPLLKGKRLRGSDSDGCDSVGIFIYPS